MAELYDLHNHLGSTDDPAAFAASLRGLGIAGSLSCTVTPDDYEKARHELANAPGVRVALGMHPWWVADDRADAASLERFAALAPQAPYLGELGLDLTPRAAEAIERQQAYLRECIRVSKATARLYSFHGSHAAGLVLDLLESEHLTENVPCLLHWFNGTSQELTRARRLGCYFSVNGRMLETKRGRAYVQAIAQNRLLLETDGPYERYGLTTPETMADDLASTLAALESIRGESLAEVIAETSRSLLEL